MSLFDTYFKVHEHGFIALKDMMGGDLDIERAARVSYGKGTRTKSDTENLIRYLKRSKHTSPFEHIKFSFHVKLPIFVERQWVRHRMSNLSEYSLRYSEAIDDFYIPQEFKGQSKTNKQGSEGLIDEQTDARSICIENNLDAYDSYTNLLNYGVSRELARTVLPVSNYTMKYWTIDLHNLFHFLKLRLNPHAQQEIRDYAHIIACILREEVPIAFKAFLDYDLNRVEMRQEEIEAIIFNMYDYGCSGEELLTKKGYSKSEIIEWEAKVNYTPIPIEHYDYTQLETVNPTET